MSLPFKSDSLVVVSGGAGDPKIVAGVGDPVTGVNAPEGSLYLRYVATNGRLYVKTGPGDTDWSNVPFSGGSTLDSAYDFGGAGVGRTINADSGALQVNAFTADTQAALLIDRSPSATVAAVGIDLTLGANAIGGQGIRVTDNGTGISFIANKNAAGIAFNAVLANAGAQALVVAVNAAPTSASPVSITANVNGTTATLLSISKIPTSVSTAGAGIGVSMGALTTGPAITVSAFGTGPALQISAGAIEAADASAAAVSPSNTGRIRYNSGTQRFQVSLNGAAYVDMATGAGMTIGGTITGATQGSVLFAGASGVLAQDNARLFWDDTGKALTVTSNSAATPIKAINADSAAGAMAIQNTNVNGPVDFFAIDSAGTARMSWGYGNASYSDTARVGRGYVWRNGVNFVFARTNVVDGFIDTAGRFGIGTLTSLDTNTLLHVNSGSSGAIASTTGSIVTVERNGNVYLTLKGPTANDKGILFSNPTSAVDGGIIYDNASLARGLQFRTGANNTRFTIDSTGVVSVVGIAATDSLIVSTGNVRVDNGQTYLKRDHPTDGPLFVQGTNATNVNPSAVGFLNQASSFRGYLGYFPSAYAFTHLRLLNGWFAQTGEDIAFATSTENAFRFGMTSNSAFMALANGGSSAVSAANTGRLIYNTTGQKAQWSFNGAAYFDAATYAAALTTGSVPFANGSNQLAQDNANLFWDNTNKFLGVGTASPSQTLDIRSNNVGGGNVRMQNGVNGFTSIAWFDSGASQKMALMYGNSGPGAPYAGKVSFFGSVNTQWLDASSNPALDITPILDTVKIEFCNGSSAALSATNRGTLRYNTTGQKFQVSLNNAAYVDLLTSATGALQTTTLTAGAGLTGGGDLSTNRTFDVGAGVGILANANDVAVDQSTAFAWTGVQSWKTHANFAGSQSFLVTAAVQTTDATQTHVAVLTLPDTTLLQIEFDAIGRDVAGVERALFGKAALVYREGGGATIQGTEITNRDIHTNPSLSADITVSGNIVRISFTGLAATTINWVSTIRYQAVSGAA